MDHNLEQKLTTDTPSDANPEHPEHWRPEHARAIQNTRDTRLNLLGSIMVRERLANAILWHVNYENLRMSDFELVQAAVKSYQRHAGRALNLT